MSKIIKKSSKEGSRGFVIRRFCDIFGILLGHNQIFISIFVVDRETSKIQL